MTYVDFNNNAFQYFYQKAHLPYCTFAVDNEALSIICGGNPLPVFTNLHSSWTSLLYEDNIPQYFGLLAIQCYAAILMENDAEGSIKAYKLRLMHLVGLKTIEELDSLIDERLEGQPIQESIWLTAQKYVGDHWGQQLTLPVVRTHAGRYVQFPKSQALLNKEDLKNFVPIFGQYFPPPENINFDYFRNHLNRYFKEISSSKVRGIFNDPLKSEAAYRQAYNYFLSWDGTYQSICDSYETTKTYQQLILVFDKGLPRFYSLSDLKEVFVEKILSSSGFYNFHKELKIFNKREYAEDEYEDSPSIYSNEECYILLRNYNPIEVYKFLLNRNIEKYVLSDNHTLFKILPDDNVINTVLREYSSAQHLIKLLGGLRITNRRVYFSRLGPTIQASTIYQVFLNGILIDYNPTTCTQGIYIVRGKNSVGISFIITERSLLSKIVESRNFGWQFCDLSLGNTPDMEGAILKVIKKKEEPFTTWLNLLQNRSNRLVKKEYTNILFKALNNIHD